MAIGGVTVAEAIVGFSLFLAPLDGAIARVVQTGDWERFERELDAMSDRDLGVGNKKPLR